MAEGDVTRLALGAKLLPPRVKAMRRERLESRLHEVWDHRLGLVLAPAGYGKTTLLTQFAAATHAPVAWYRADGNDASATRLLRHLEKALSAALDGLAIGWSDVDDVVDALARWPGERALLVVDDVHLLDGLAAAETTLSRLVDDAPHSLTFLFAGRRAPRFNLPRMRVSGALLEIGADDLRFRSWEVERLFRDFYQEVLSPEDLAALARRTEGWAAGLQLFHLATKGKSPRAQRTVLEELTAGSRVTREYLALNVLDELPAKVSRFLMETSVLGCLTGPLCDRLLGTSGSEEILVRLEQGQVFTALDDSGVYRYHEVLRSHLEAVLVQRLGEAAARERCRTAARLLEEAGAVSDAIRAYARGGDEEAAAKLLATHVEDIVDGCERWAEGLPSTLVDNDPWLKLARARRAVAAGCWATAVDFYRAAEQSFGATAAIEVCRRERQALAVWLEPLLVPPVDESGLVRAATEREPLAARRLAEGAGGARGALAAGLGALLAGHARDASTALDEVAARHDAGPVLALGARIAARVAAALAGRTTEVVADFEDLAIEGERLGAPWLARLARALVGLGGQPDGEVEAAELRRYCESNGDRWGAALGACLEGLSALAAGTDAVAPLAAAAEGFSALGGRVLEAWSRSAMAMAMAHAADPRAKAAARAAESLARTTGTPGAEALAFGALAVCDCGRDAGLREQARALADRCGLDLDAVVHGRPNPIGTATVATEPDDSEPPSAPAPPPVAVRCLGAFSIAVSGAPADCFTVKPRARSCLRLLAVHLGRPVHRETLVAVLWPDQDGPSGLRNLHVVISALRHLLEPGVARGASSLIVREGDTYRLALPPGSQSDLVEFEAALQRARAARVQGGDDGARTGFSAALDLYRGELLPDVGPAEWVLAERERYRMAAADAAQALGELELAAGNAAAALVACERGLRIDQHRDQLWRLRIEACDRAGDPAEAASARMGYAAMLADLGLEPTGAVSGSRP